MRAGAPRPPPWSPATSAGGLVRAGAPVPPRAAVGRPRARGGTPRSLQDRGVPVPGGLVRAGAPRAPRLAPVPRTWRPRARGAPGPWPGHRFREPVAASCARGTPSAVPDLAAPRPGGGLVRAGHPVMCTVPDTCPPRRPRAHGPPDPRTPTAPPWTHPARGTSLADGRPVRRARPSAIRPRRERRRRPARTPRPGSRPPRTCRPTRRRSRRGAARGPGRPRAGPRPA